MAVLLAVIVALVLFVFWRTRYPAPAVQYRHLRPSDVVVIEAIADVMFPPGGALAVSGRDAGVTEYIDRYMGWHSRTLRVMIHLMFILIEQGTLLFAPSLQRFSSLSPAARERYLAGWEHSRVYLRRMVFQSLRALMSMAFLASSDVAGAIGYERPERCRTEALTDASHG